MSSVFIKHNLSGYKDSLLVEARGLEAIKTVIEKRKVSEISVPEVIECDLNTLSLTLIDVKAASELQMRMLGFGLAKIHHCQFDYFGLDYDNYIGLNPQKNGTFKDWGEFFIEQRLSFQISMIKDSEIRKCFEETLTVSKNLLKNYLNSACSQPSLVHGDLWSGNVLFDERRVWLIDPAVYYADKEVDIAMTEMFGGFGSSFYRGYQEISPLSPEYPIKREIYNLYHYLNHYNLFGQSYLHACKSRMELLKKL